MTERPFVHKSAFSDVKLNFIFQDEVVNILKKVINKSGVLNIGGPTKTVYDFAKKYNPNVKKISSKNLKKIKYQKNMSMNLAKLNKIIN